jgi:hypothetical protein
MRNSVADHGRVHVLGASDLPESPAHNGAPPARRQGFGVGQVRKTRCVPLRLDKEMA